MCEGSNGSSDHAVSGNMQVSADLHDVQEGMGEPFEPFVCQICLDIAYKPIVLQGCGHVFCFWCVRRSMNEMKPSQCPACRGAYLHFPRVCRLLHFLLEKAWPVHYQRKARETLAMEQKTAVFSPRIIPRHYQADADQSFKAGSSHKLHVYPELAMQPAAGEEVDEETKKTIGIEDVCCSACRKLLYRPVVINCGEVMCEWCWNERASDVASSNPVRVCLPLHHYLQGAFSSLYSQRQLDTPGNKEKRQTKDVVLESDLEEDNGFVHIGVGCDGCGMFPIIGRKRYHCVECGERVGYDLCHSCYDSGMDANEAAKVRDGSNKCSSKDDEVMEGTPCDGVVQYGRFDQQHSAQHQMVAMTSTHRAHPTTFNAMLHFLQRRTAPLHFDLLNGSISRRRRSHQQIMDDFDDYIDNLI